MNNIKNIKNFIFDCDGVLYQDLKAVFGQVSRKMTKYISEKLKEEWLLCGVVSSESEFYQLQLDFLINHQFHTEFMRKNGKKLKEKNLRYAHEMMKSHN